MRYLCYWGTHEETTSRAVFETKHTLVSGIGNVGAIGVASEQRRGRDRSHVGACACNVGSGRERWAEGGGGGGRGCRCGAGGRGAVCAGQCNPDACVRERGRALGAPIARDAEYKTLAHSSCVWLIWSVSVSAAIHMNVPTMGRVCSARASMGKPDYGSTQHRPTTVHHTWTT